MNKPDDLSSTNVLFHEKNIDEAFSSLSTDANGLTLDEVKSRIATYGENTLPMSPPTPAWKRFLSQFHNVLIYVLLASAVVSFFLQHYVDCGVIFAVVMINALVGFIQEGKAEKALRAILSMTKTHCMVIRESTLTSIDSTQLVPGDIVSLQAGDRVPADCRLFYCKDLRSDESALTGESQPIGKITEPMPPNTPLAERKNMIYMGTMVTYGTARAVVCATGLKTEIGTISDLVNQTELPQTPLQKQLAIFAKQLSVGILIISALSMLFGMLFRGYDFREMFQAAIGIAVASIPEGLPAIVTIALAIGVQRMAKNKALVRRLPSVEVLGSVDVICSDKTGTLTTNEMTARALTHANASFNIEGEGYTPHGRIINTDTNSHTEIANDRLVNRACTIAMLCNDANLTNENGDWTLHGDPTEGALMTLAMKHGLTKDSLHHDWPKIDELPFETEKRYMATLHRDNEGHRKLFIKGAPDRILEYCTHQLTDDGTVVLNASYWQTALQEMAEQGMRVIALAQKAIDNNTTLGHTLVENQLTLVALAGISDPPRPQAIKSIKKCHTAGITVKMITGDNPITAMAIGKELNIEANDYLTGQMLDELTSDVFGQQIEPIHIFARTSPKNKLQLVEALQNSGHTVAMTGDGVNDAPALRKADIGVAMGKRGTDAAKEASDIVLTDDRFSSITKAIIEGRTVYDNIVKSILFILPTNLAEAAVIIGAIITGSMLPITPAQIIWVNMVTAVTLALALAFEKPEPGIMLRPPRPKGQGLITPSLLVRLLLVGLTAAAIIFWLFESYLAKGASVEFSRTVAVNTLVMIEAVYLMNCRFLHRSLFTKDILHGALPSLIAIVTVISVQLIFTYLPISQALFGLSPIGINDWLTIIAVSLPILLVVELEKWAWSIHMRHKQAQLVK